MNRWVIPRKNYFDKPDNFPYRLMVTIVIAIFLLCFGYNALTIPLSDKFGMQLLDKAGGISLSLSLLFIAILVTAYRIIAFHYRFAEYIERYGMYRWKRWAINTLVLLDFSSITPVPDLSLKMQKLEGDAPLYPATPLRIAVESEDIGVSRFGQVLITLLKPLKGSLIRGPYPFEIGIYVRGSDKSVCDELSTVLAQLVTDRNKIGDIHLLETCPDYRLINTWMDETTRRNRLLIAIELHNDEQQDFFESASAFVFTGQDLLREQDTPMFLLRTMNTDSYHLDSIAHAYFSAEQVDVKKINRLWSSGLDKQAKLILHAAVDNAGTGVAAGSRYDLETVTGNASEVQKWMLLALAADAAKHGQGHQLITTSAADKIYTGIVTFKDPGRWREPRAFYATIYWFSTALFLTLLFLLATITLIPVGFFNEEGSGWFLVGLSAFASITYFGTFKFAFNKAMKSIQESMQVFHPRYY
ncbi:hypothetical protein [Atlantibacter sp.]|uniref:hypothetical protein n=1 Tax=Atlantibacter sp. TaxID=1903473 RepID=UPI0028B0B3D7|nr:hypothetical protein [Atlantibacter sp.]